MVIMPSVSPFPLINSECSVGTPGWGMDGELCQQTQLCPVSLHWPLPCAHTRGWVIKGSCGKPLLKIRNNLGCPAAGHRLGRQIWSCWEVQVPNLGVIINSCIHLPVASLPMAQSRLRLQGSESQVTLLEWRWRAGQGERCLLSGHWSCCHCLLH